MKYAKLYRSIFRGSLGQDWRLRSLFFDLLAMCDWNGRVKEDYGHIAALTCRNIDDVINGLAKLMEPDPASRSNKREGRRLCWFDSKRPHLGFQIVNYELYRDRGRRKRADYMRDYRAKKRNQSVTMALPERNQNSPSERNQSVTTPVPECNHKNKIEDINNKNSLSLPSLNSEPKGDSIAKGIEAFTDWDDEHLAAFLAEYGPGRLPAVDELPEDVKAEVVRTVFVLREKKNGGPG